MASVRKQPAQERSRATVDRLVDAATRVLAEHGYQAASTNRIAREAGVSPGTLYQYFSDKDELVVAVIERILEGFSAAVAPALRESAGKPPVDGTRAVLHAVVAHLEPRAALMAALVDRVPPDRYAPALQSVRARVSDVTFQLFAARAPGAEIAQLERTTWLAVTLTEQLTVRYIVERPAITRDAFVDELTALLIGLTFGRAAAGVAL